MKIDSKTVQQQASFVIMGIGLGVLITTIVFRNQPPQVIVYKAQPCKCGEEVEADVTTGNGAGETEQSSTED